MKLRFNSGATVDYLDAIAYYAEIDTRVAAKFIREIEAGQKLVGAFPEWCPRFHGRFRRYKTKSFPYGVFYVLERDEVVIYAVLNLLQDPEAIRTRLNR